MDQFLTITWDASRGLDLGFFTIRYYSLLFASGFVMGYFIMKRIFQKEGVPQEKLDTLLTYTVVATIIGARLGHVFFYQWDYYSKHPMDILKVWEGGLASHGAVISIIIAIIIYSRKVLKKPVLWMLDRLVITIALAGCMIRLGNFANSEIYGDVGNSSIEMVFTNPVRERIVNAYGDMINSVEFELTDAERVTDSIIYPIYQLEIEFSNKVKTQELGNRIVFGGIKPLLSSTHKEDMNMLIDGSRLEWPEGKENTAVITALGLPRSPTQLFEAFGYLMVFFILFRLFQLKNVAQRQGLIFGLFLLLVFGFRFFIEYFKENQVVAEQGRVLNIGQMLSIPAVLTGLFFIFFSKKTSNEG